MPGARHFQELDCWQRAIELKLELYQLTERPSVRANLKFRDQLREAAASAPRIIAEGFGRRTNADFANYLDIARGSLGECQNLLQDAVDRAYLNPEDFKTLSALAARTSGAVAALQRWLRRDQAMRAGTRRTWRPRLFHWKV